MKVMYTRNHRDKILIGTALSYACVALVSAAVAIAGNLPSEFMGHTPETTVIQDFLLPWGWGTGMSPPLILIVLVLLISGLLAKGTSFVVSSFNYASPEEPHSVIGEINNFANLGGQLIIFAWRIDYADYGNTDGMEVWKSDGTGVDGENKRNSFGRTRRRWFSYSP